MTENNTNYTIPAHHETGNTNRENPVSRKRRWFLTINHNSTEDFQTLLDLNTRTLVFQTEIGESGTPHIQCTLELKDAKTFNAMKKIFPRAHLEVPKHWARSIKYCYKDDTFTGERRYVKINNNVLYDISNDDININTVSHARRDSTHDRPRVGSQEFIDMIKDDFEKWIYERLFHPK